MIKLRLNVLASHRGVHKLGITFTCTKEKLKAHKSLDALNYFCSGHVRTVYFYGHGDYAVLKALVNPSQKSPDQAHKPWVVLRKSDAEIQTAHCTCKAG